MIKNIYFILICLLVNPLFSQEVSFPFEENAESLKEFRRHLVLEVDRLHRNDAFQTETLREGVREARNQIEVFPFFEQLLMSRAHANAASICLYGGWPSFTDSETQRCRAPWNYSDSPVLRSYGATYSRDQHCGGVNRFRCNPTLFGEGRNGSGHCVTYADTDNLTDLCYRASQEHSDFSEEYFSDPSRRTHFHNLSTLVINNCQAGSERSASCEYLLRHYGQLQNLYCENEMINRVLAQTEVDSLADAFNDITEAIAENADLFDTPDQQETRDVRLPDSPDEHVDDPSLLQRDRTESPEDRGRQTPETTDFGTGEPGEAREGVNQGFRHYGVDPDNQREGCDVLDTNPLREEDFERLQVCMNSIREFLTQGVNLPRVGQMGEQAIQAKNTVFERMYMLNEEEQRFLAMTLTSVGEAGELAPPLEEMIMVMKTIENRARHARERGVENAHELDAALQPWQFSMYNVGENWPRSLMDNSSQTSNAIKAFISYQNTDFSSTPNLDQIFHYHTDYVSPDWREPAKRINPIRINGQQIKNSGSKYHIFYRDIAWAFRHNSWSNK